MRQIALFNKGIDQEIAKNAIASLTADYTASGVDFSSEYEEIDIPDIRFVKYNPRSYSNSLGLDFLIISRIAKDVKKRHGNKYDLITIFISKEDWQMGDERVLGWNMGEFFSGYQIQQVGVFEQRLTYLVLAQEIMHSFDQFIKLELGINIAKLLGVKDFDEDIVHYYQFEYKEWYKKLALLLNRTFEIRKVRYKLNQKQFSLIEILKMLIQELKMQIINAKRSVIKVVVDLSDLNK